MRRTLAVLVFALIPLAAFAEEVPVTRRNGFLTIWQSLRRPVLPNREQPFTDVSESSAGFSEINYAKYRGILDDENTFRPDDRLQLHEALVWLLRSRSVDEPAAIQPATLSGYLLKYPLSLLPTEYLTSGFVTEDRLLALMRDLDARLAAEDHEVSLYAEKFHGKGTAFGETFDMHALTAAHRTYPHNTLVRVTNIVNGKSVVLRINDRGPYVSGRDMDLSLAAFTSIADRQLGVIRARFERLGDATLVGGCGGNARYQMRLTRDVHLQRGIPHTFPLGESLVLRANKPFVVRSVRYPDGNQQSVQDWIPLGEHFTMKPSMPGDYVFRLGTLHGKHRTMRMRVVECEQRGPL